MRLLEKKNDLTANWNDAPAWPRKLAVEVTFQFGEVTSSSNHNQMTNWPWLPLPVQWLARFGIYRSHPRAARRRSSAAGCSPPRRCPKPEFGSFEGGLGLFCESLNGEQSPRGGSSDTTWIWTEWGFLGCWTLMCWEGWRGRRVVIPKLSVPSFGLALPALCHTHHYTSNSALQTFLCWKHP